MKRQLVRLDTYYVYEAEVVGLMSTKVLLSNRKFTITPRAMNSTDDDFELIFKNLTLVGHDKKFLDDVTGYAKKGELLAIIGPSGFSFVYKHKGSGKTSLLNILSFRKELLGLEKSHIFGTVWLGRKPINKNDKKRIGYVMQEDIFFEMLTLKETMMTEIILQHISPIAKKKSNKSGYCMQLLLLTRRIYPELSVIRKERMSKMYHLSAYFHGKIFSDFLIVLLRPTLMWTIIYWMAGLNKSAWFLVSLAIMYLMAAVGQAIGFFFASFGMTYVESAGISSVFMTLCILVGGFFNKNIPTWLAWAKYISPIHYSYALQSWIQFKAFDGLKCSSS
ncbi:hypothetical protein MXB_4068, partial [Myxobolus squamalis]